MIKLVIDCASEIMAKEAEELGIISLPMKVSFGDDEYIPGITLTTDEFFGKLKQSKDLPHTSQINAYDYVETLRPLLENGDEVFCMVMSSGLSGSHNSLLLAEKELNNSRLVVFDTLSVTFAYKALVLEALKLIKQGITLSKLKEAMEQLKQKVRLVAIIDNVKYLVKGGRLSLAKGMIVEALNIKPIIAIEEGLVKMKGKAFGYGMAKKSLLKLIQNIDTSYPIYYGHSANVEKGQDFKRFIEDQLHLTFVEPICSIGPVIGTHAGPNCVGLVYFAE